ncbi:MAG: hypothetical protein LBU88_08095 [Treponema sp.]|nr:hypothetical protein [Treponema sp.]
MDIIRCLYCSLRRYLAKGKRFIQTFYSVLNFPMSKIKMLALRKTASPFRLFCI